MALSNIIQACVLAHQIHGWVSTGLSLYSFIHQNAWRVPRHPHRGFNKRDLYALYKNTYMVDNKDFEIYSDYLDRAFLYSSSVPFLHDTRGIDDEWTLLVPLLETVETVERVERVDIVETKQLAPKEHAIPKHRRGSMSDPGEQEEAEDYEEIKLGEIESPSEEMQNKMQNKEQSFHSPSLPKPGFSHALSNSGVTET